ncbi:MAG: chitobiase/beta-hexosaminidase C-terminal domain-containing protein [Terracidiphilus sp.]
MASCVAVMLLLALAAGTACSSANAQTGEWAWMGGSSTIPSGNYGNYDTPGVYGTLGTPDAGNVPGSRYDAASWTDSNGNFWLFGGFGVDSTGMSGQLNDLWEFNPTLGTNGEWAWMGGSSTLPPLGGGQPGVYGTLGAPAEGNVPGGRGYAASWTDESGNLWLFGGSGFSSTVTSGDLNDLWEFNPTLGTNGEWAWMGGSSTLPAGGEGQLGVYGRLGVPAAGNTPGGRSGEVTWTDKSGNFWLFGGDGWVSHGDGYEPGGAFLNDLWEFNPKLGTYGEWAWMGGSNWVPAGINANQPGIYGQQGEPTWSNVPGSRAYAVSWTDDSGNLWLFGGFGADSTGAIGYLNDFWEFNPTLGLNGEWAWMGGSSSVPLWGGGWPGIYGTLGLPAAANIPGSREGSIGWTDSNGNFWLFGGFGVDSVSNESSLNDLWSFDPHTFDWTWMNGTSVLPYDLIPPNEYAFGAPATFGTLGVPAAGNVPWGTWSASGWFDDGGNLWLFGGVAYVAYAEEVNLDDLWKYQPPAPAAAPTFLVAAGTYNSEQSVTISDTTPGATIFYVIDGVSTTPTSSTPYSGPIPVNATETIEAVAAATGYSDSAVASATYTLNLPNFTLGASPATLVLASGGTGTTTLTVTPQNGFNAAVSFACSGLPAGASCSFNPATVTPSGAAAKTTLTINAQTLTAAVHRNSRPLFPATVLALTLCIFGWKKRRGLQLVLLLAMTSAGLGLLSGCGGGSGGGGGGGVMQVASPITVTATSGTIQQTATVTLAVN